MITVTTDTIQTVTGSTQPTLVLRQDQISSKPAYATYCANESAYSSACSCIGSTVRTVTAPQPTVYISVTAANTFFETATWTNTATVTVTPPPPACATGLTRYGSECVVVQSSPSSCGACGNTVSFMPPTLEWKTTCRQCASSQTCGAGVCVLPDIYFCTEEYSPCGGACNGYCFLDVTGQGYCKQARSCSELLRCSSNTDCDSLICTSNNCGQVCAQTQYLCPNPVVTARLFRKKAGHIGRGARVLAEIGWSDE